ncbi:MAG: lipoate--protein ligase [Clostridiales bacterium]|nr:lipoate--protein ligase [Clostridiales bacterium]
MKFCILQTTDPHYNLAVEEYLFNTAQDDVFLLWQNYNTVVIGKNQNAYAEIDMQVLKENGVNIARRITGGGAVYHDLGNVNYSFISPNAKTSGIDFSYYATPIVNALKNLGLSVNLSGRNDLITNDGKKISGNAQHRVNDRVLHHGTLLFDSNLEFLSKVLTVDSDKLKTKALKSTRSRVENISSLIKNSISTSEFISCLSSFIIDNYSPEIITVDTNDKINELYERNKSIGWLFPEKDFISKYQIIRKKRFDFGSVELYLELKNDVVLSLKIKGDFFSEKPIEELEKTFENKELSSIQTCLEGIVVSDYILGMSNLEFIELIAN